MAHLSRNKSCILTQSTQRKTVFSFLEGHRLLISEETQNTLLAREHAHTLAQKRQRIFGPTLTDGPTLPKEQCNGGKNGHQ